MAPIERSSDDLRQERIDAGKTLPRVGDVFDGDAGRLTVTATSTTSAPAITGHFRPERYPSEAERLREALDQVHGEVLVGDKETAMRVIERVLGWDEGDHGVR